MGYLVLLVALGSAALYCHNEKRKKEKKQPSENQNEKTEGFRKFLQHRGFTSITIDYANEHRITKRTAIASGL